MNKTVNLTNINLLTKEKFDDIETLAETELYAVKTTVGIPRLDILTQSVINKVPVIENNSWRQVDRDLFLVIKMQRNNSSNSITISFMDENENIFVDELEIFNTGNIAAIMFYTMFVPKGWSYKIKQTTVGDVVQVDEYGFWGGKYEINS